MKKFKDAIGDLFSSIITNLPVLIFLGFGVKYLAFGIENLASAIGAICITTIYGLFIYIKRGDDSWKVAVLKEMASLKTMMSQFKLGKSLRESHGENKEKRRW